MKKNGRQKTINLMVRVTPSLHEALLAYKKARGVSLQWLATAALQKYLKIDTQC